MRLKYGNFTFVWVLALSVTAYVKLKSNSYELLRSFHRLILNNA